ncbi:MAG: tripartite tricarboxylate transporter substrate binding protein [Paracoccus denitrificans]|uniref:Tripartite tricarboxylate transporter substrate binding protein n=1 Tax=Paracoccus denitrificans TaxID=266 RepID=A0A533HZF3_PARDE|nr:MAG: tripartite tricarboxylate transporter substrate binding protein [Paracoccus denitrificans]
MRPNMTGVAGVSCMLAMVAGAGGALAQDVTYSGGDKVTVLMGFAPGGGSDTLAQLVQPLLAEELGGVSFVNQYQPGATGAIAWTQLAKQVKPDGQTISITNTPMLMTNYIMNDAITYSIDELDPIANIVTDPGIVVVNPDSKFTDFNQLVEEAKANPGTVTVGNSGVGGDDFFTSILLEQNAGVQFQKVPFKGDGPSWTAAMGGKIDASFNNVGITYPQIAEGNLRPLVVFAEERLAELPDVPTAKELGFDIVSGSSRGYSAPKGLPAEAKQQLVDAMTRVVERPEFKEAAAKQAMNVDFIAGDDYAAFLKAQEEEFRGVWDSVKDDYEATK